MDRAGDLHPKDGQTDGERCRNGREGVPAAHRRNRVVDGGLVAREAVRQRKELRDDCADDGREDVPADEVARLAERRFGDGVEEDGGRAERADREWGRGKRRAGDARQAGRDAAGDEDRCERAKEAEEVVFVGGREVTQRADQRRRQASFKDKTTSSAHAWTGKDEGRRTHLCPLTPTKCLARRTNHRALCFRHSCRTFFSFSLRSRSISRATRSRSRSSFDLTFSSPSASLRRFSAAPVSCAASLGCPWWNPRNKGALLPSRLSPRSLPVPAVASVPTLSLRVGSPAASVQYARCVLPLECDCECEKLPLDAEAAATAAGGDDSVRRETGAGWSGAGNAGAGGGEAMAPESF